MRSLPLQAYVMVTLTETLAPGASDPLVWLKEAPDELLDADQLRLVWPVFMSVTVHTQFS